jgi:hypothetical protein
MIASAGWVLQLLALALVGSSLLIGLVYNEVRAELAVCAVGAVMFLFGRWLQNRQGR